MIRPWTWDAATAIERGAWVRQHLSACKYDLAALCDLFCLTEEGAELILDGDIWRQDYQRSLPPSHPGADLREGRAAGER